MRFKIMRLVVIICLVGVAFNSIQTALATSQTYFHQLDHLSGQGVTTNEVGQPAEVSDYDPFGATTLNDQLGAYMEQRRYGGYQEDTNGLNYLGARYYDAKLRKFLSMDPAAQNVEQSLLADPQQLNTYSYARNNPLRYRDDGGEKISDYKAAPLSGAVVYASGTTLATYKGVPIMSNGGATGTTKGPYQCVALVKSFYQQKFGLAIGVVKTAENMANAYTQSAMSNALSAYTNGATSELPQEDDIITWRGGSAGHTGIVAEVVVDNKTGSGTVWTIEQNVSKNKGLFANKLVTNNGQRYIESRGQLEVINWQRPTVVSAPVNNTQTPSTKSAGIWRSIVTRLKNIISRGRW